MRVRDFLITLLAWVLLAWLLRGAILLLVDWLSDPIFQLTVQTAPDWPLIAARLAPFLAAVAALVAWLSYWAVRRSRTLRLTRDPSQPPALEPAAHAAFFGLQEAEIRRWRAMRVATVHFDASGRPTRAD